MAIHHKQFKRLISKMHKALDNGSMSNTHQKQFVRLVKFSLSVTAVICFVYASLSVMMPFNGFYDTDGLSYIIYPIPIKNLNDTSLLFIVTVNLLLSAIVYNGLFLLLTVNICITFFEVKLFSNLNTELDERISNLSSTKLNGSSTRIDALRRKHLEICSIVELHDSVYRTPIGIIFTVFVIQTCITVYSLATGASTVTELTTLIVQLGFGSFYVAVSIGCGIQLNKSVSKSFLFGHFHS